MCRTHSGLLPSCVQRRLVSVLPYFATTNCKCWIFLSCYVNWDSYKLEPRSNDKLTIRSWFSGTIPEIILVFRNNFVPNVAPVFLFSPFYSGTFLATFPTMRQQQCFAGQQNAWTYVQRVCHFSAVPVGHRKTVAVANGSMTVSCLQKARKHLSHELSHGSAVTGGGLDGQGSSCSTNRPDCFWVPSSL